MIEGDVCDQAGLRRSIEEAKPDEVYNLAAQSHVRVSFDLPIHTADVTGLGTLRLLEALRDVSRSGGKAPRFYQASSSEMFGQAKESPQRESTPFHPRSPYACAKAYAHWQHSCQLPRKATGFSPAAAFSLTTSLPAAARISSPARSPAPPPASSWACRDSLALGD